MKIRTKGFISKKDAKRRQDQIASMAKEMCAVYSSFHSVKEHGDWELYETALLKAEEFYDNLNDTLEDD